MDVISFRECLEFDLGRDSRINFVFNLSNLSTDISEASLKISHTVLNRLGIINIHRTRRTTSRTIWGRGTGTFGRMNVRLRIGGPFVCSVIKINRGFSQDNWQQRRIVRFRTSE